MDDFIYKSDMTKQLIPRIFAADRMADRQNTLLRANALLVENNRELESSNIIDMETGLCNAKYARQRLQKILRHAESRGGASAYVTDSPYLAPVPYRGKPNEPAWVVEVAQCIARERSISLEEVAMQTTANFYRLFRGAAPEPSSAAREALVRAGLV